MVDYIVSHLWMLWLIIAVVCMLAEILSFDFFVTCFAIGALGGIACALMGLPLWVQILVWAAVSVVSVFYLRPVLKAMVGDRKHRQSNADALIGKEGKVIEAITADGHGYVKIDGDEWRSVSAHGEEIAVGTKVRVITRDSIIMTVEKA